MAVANLGDKIIARPNNSLSVDDSVKLLAALAGIALVVALGFLHIGAWLVLPFAGAEMILVAGAFYYMQCHADDFESITIIGDELSLDKRDYKQTSRVVLNCYWAKVLLVKQPSGDHALLLKSHGKEYEFGKRLMHDEDKVALAKQLKQRVGA